MSDRAKLLDVIGLCEKAAQPSRMLWLSVGEIVFGPTLTATKDGSDFLHFVNAGAWFDAALLLVPEGWMIERLMQFPTKWRCGLFHHHEDHPGPDCEAVTAPLALTIAALRARLPEMKP